MARAARSLGSGVLALALLSSGACSAPTPPPPVELDEARVTRAFEALKPILDEDTQVLEIRATPEAVHVQVAQLEATPPVVVEYRQLLDRDDAVGTLQGPQPVPLQGSGDLRENAFGWSELNLPKIAAAFQLARRSVDPSDGRVQELVIRRMLPIHRGIRARIFVASPRMNGSLDTNQNGIPVKS